MDSEIAKKKRHDGDDQSDDDPASNATGDVTEKNHVVGSR